MCRQEAETEVAAARAKWLNARKTVLERARDLFQPGIGYGAPEALASAERELQTAREEAQWSYIEYNEAARRDLEMKMLAVERSIRLATWASFAAAAVIALATVATVLVTLLR